MIRSAYRLLGYFGIASVFGSMVLGFRHDSSAPYVNYLWNLLLFLGWAAVHLGMTRATFKRAVYGARAGSHAERRVYILISIATWWALYWAHLPTPGWELDVSEPLRFIAAAGFVLAVLAFFEGTTFAALDGLLGAPGASMTHSHGEETPLLSEGQYAQVRHPMYRAAILGALATVGIHANLSQAFWCAMISATFVVFIPIEERQLLAARGERYSAYMRATPWRLLPGIW